MGREAQSPFHQPGPHFALHTFHFPLSVSSTESPGLHQPGGGAGALFAAGTAARAASGIANGDDGAAVGEHVASRFHEQVHHEADDLARGQVVPGGLVGGFVEAPDEILEDETHGDVVHLVRMLRNLGELGYDKVEAIRVLQFLDFLVELKLIEDLADVLREAVDVVERSLNRTWRALLPESPPRQEADSRRK